MPASTSSLPRPSSASRVLALLLALRIVNALSLTTFFQPDEFFQSLEPAWQLAFGRASNAWITWEWAAQLRSSLHPHLFAGVYLVAAKIAALCTLSPSAHAELLIAAPKVAQAVAAALQDWYTWKLAETVFGPHSRTAFTTLALSVCSPWQWFCSTRTLSNCLETTISIAAVYYWPWHLTPAARDGVHRNHVANHIAARNIPGRVQLRVSLLLAASACILRPTNVLIWLVIALPTLWQASARARYIVIRETLFCGSGVLACSVLSDRLYYRVWTLPPLRFLYFNIAQSLAVFYGRNRTDYYLTEGLPLLLTTALPFALGGTWLAIRGKAPTEEHVARTILQRLAWTVLIVTLSLSAIAHKEVRFLYPVLPFLHVLSAGPLSSFLSPRSASRKAILTLALFVNLLIAGYASQVHQRGVIDVLTYLRHKHEARVITHGGKTTTTVGFLMPCHSTPWRSHLVHAGIDAWALTCEPPLHVPLAERHAYMDEADQFYIDLGPATWLKSNMENLQTVSGSRTQRHWAQQDATLKAADRRSWPDHLVFFEQLEPTLRKLLKDTAYSECWRGFNTHFHDDWRRKGDVVVWCLD
ncbi:hypothetical protein EJ04DRAFT_511164 [Polyplosphaeria fusca]|uniref:Mannosyltransferase n=1 Tax=Polyplosphaeria fusca TaxID=682080 RepID=A0A9P4V5G5_9PLEO|nr:hypothetical protein EJ04DRAFT_511164 [Polyplosphaeria fusca]